MTRIILQPAGGTHAREHYVDTIEQPVPFAAMQSLLSVDDTTVLQSIYGDRAVPTWGVTPGIDDGNIKKWERVQPGDVTLFSRAGYIVSSATVTHVTRNASLAEQLWGRDEKDQTWEYMYFLDEVHPQDIPYAAFNAAAGYKENNVIQGFSVLTEEQSADLLAAFDLDSLIYEPDVSDDEFGALVTELAFDPEEPLDGIGRVKLRKEQAKLRRALFEGRRLAVCGICSRELPVELLVAAHVKRRSRCSSDERRDVNNVVMAMCKLGCDELFERGFITVEEGRVVACDVAASGTAVARAVQELAGRLVRSWTPGSEPYFAWHRGFVFRGPTTG